MTLITKGKLNNGNNDNKDSKSNNNNNNNNNVILMIIIMTKVMTKVTQVFQNQLSKIISK